MASKKQENINLAVTGEEKPKKRTSSKAKDTIAKAQPEIKPSKEDYIEKGKRAFIESKEKPAQQIEVTPIKEEPPLNNIEDDEIIIIKKEQEKVDPKIEKDKKTIQRFTNVTKENGLTKEQVNQRISEGNINHNNEKGGKTTLQIICSNVFTFFNMLYLVITVLLCYAQSYKNLTFLVVVISNTLIGMIQEIKARNMIRKLTLVAQAKANVIRDGKKEVIDARDVVIDDVVVFTIGNQIYSDSIVMDGNLEVNESMITGESDAISKKPGDFLYSGSFVVSGNAYAKIENVGKKNYIEKLATEAKKQKGRKSELLRTLNAIIKTIGFIIVPLFIVQLIQAWAGKEPDMSFNLWFQDSIKTISGSIIGLIPSGLFLLTSIALFTAIWRLGKRNNTLVQESYSIEMLARVDTLCLDKTGTITDGTMRVIDCIEIDNKTDYSIREIVGSMMSTFKDVNATSEAMIRFFSKNNVLTPEAVLPFSSKRKFSAITFKGVGTFYLGAPEFVLIDNYKKVQSKIEKYASQGCRVLALAYTNTGIKKEGIATNAKVVALIIIQDHIREDAYETIEYFRNNDVDIKVISGDNPITVSEIARRVGIPNAHRYISLEGLSDEEVKDVALDYTIFGRVTPNQKRALVVAFKEHKRTVAMTGDGVNDILAMKESDCSIAMASGSEATKNIANIVLMDSNFASMPAVVSEGRRVINNIQRTSSLFLVKTLFTLFLTVFYLILGTSIKYPFEPSQLLLIEMFIIGLPSTVISLQPNNERVKGHFMLNVVKASLPGALVILCFHIGVWYFTIKSPLESFPSLIGIGSDMSIYSTILLIVSIVVCLFVLYRMCKPFNLMRRILFGFVVVVCVSCILFANTHLFNDVLKINNFLGFVKLDEFQTSFTIICLLLINVVFNFIDKLVYRVEKIKL